MTRKEKYKDTNTFHFFNANPKGRTTTDCVIRAICTATEIDYKTVVMEMAAMQCETGYDGGDAKLYDKYLLSKGWRKVKQPRKEDNTKFTGAEWCKELDYVPINGDSLIANIGGGHMVCIKETREDSGRYRFKVWDTWDSTSKCVGNYWIRI